MATSTSSTSSAVSATVRHTSGCRSCCAHSTASRSLYNLSACCSLRAARCVVGQLSEKQE